MVGEAKWLERFCRHFRRNSVECYHFVLSPFPFHVTPKSKISSPRGGGGALVAPGSLQKHVRSLSQSLCTEGDYCGFCSEAK